MDSSREPSSILERDGDIVPELPTDAGIVAATSGTSYYQHHTTTSSNNRSSSPPRRRPSNASHVAVDYFDPEGVSELKRTFTRQSTSRRSEHNVPPPTRGSVHSESTAVSSAAASPEKFDFEQHLKDMVQRYEILSFHVN